MITSRDFPGFAYAAALPAAVPPGPYAATFGQRLESNLAIPPCPAGGPAAFVMAFIPELGTCLAGAASNGVAWLWNGWVTGWR